jgi:oligoendopeptidase F
LVAAYQKITGGLTVDWNGREENRSAVAALPEGSRSTVREKAFRLGAQAYMDQRGEMATLFDQMYEKRQQVAKNAGFGDFSRTRSSRSTGSTTRPRTALRSIAPWKKPSHPPWSE